MKIEILSRWMAEDAGYMARYLTEPYIWISIGQPEDKRETSPAQNKWCRGVCRLQFHDIKTPVENLMFFNETHAKIILDFVKSHKNEISLICVHCEAGISRSAAVAMALDLWLNHDFHRFVPNMHVVSVILKHLSKTT